MTRFPLHTLRSAPEKSKLALGALQENFGFIPNIAAAMASSPVLINSLLDLFGRVHGGSFSERQIQVLLLTNAVANRCSWAVAFHSFLALRQGIDEEDVGLIRRGGAPRDAGLAALSVLARTLIEKRGLLDEADLSAFAAAGFTPELALEVISVVAASTITNYTGNVARPAVEENFRPYL